MILEGLITSCDAAGGLHLAAMGPEVDEAACLGGAIEQLVLKPFETSQTAANLARLPEGVFHLSDDVLLLKGMAEAFDDDFLFADEFIYQQGT